MLNENNNFEINFNSEEEIKERIIHCLNSGLENQLKLLFNELHPADQADLISNLDNEDIDKIISIVLVEDVNPDFISYLDNTIIRYLIKKIGNVKASKIINKLELGDAVDVIEELHNDEIKEILIYIPNEKREKIEDSLSYPENSIGRFMQKGFIAAKKDWNVAQTTYHIQNLKNIPDDFTNLVIVDDNFKPISEVKVSKILRNKKEVLIADIMSNSDDIIVLPTRTDKEEAAQIFSKYSLTYVPVVNERGVLVGVLYPENIINIIHEEAEEDILRLGGVQTLNLRSGKIKTAISRIPWLITSLIASILSVSAIDFFSEEIERLVALAALMPIVPALSGNSGTQTLTVLVRAISTNEINNFGFFKIIFKECTVGFFNGLALSIVASVICFVWQEDLKICMVLAMAIICTTTIGGFVGSIIPITLHKLKFDPAISSGAFLTAITDSASFFIFLGLASILI